MKYDKAYSFLIAFFCLVSASFGQQIFNVRQFGAKGNGRTNDAAAFQKAIDACSKAGGGKVLVHIARWHVRPPTLRSGWFC